MRHAITDEPLELNTETLAYIEAVGKYSIAHDINGKAHSVALALNEWQQNLEPALFFRVHKSFILNLRHVYDWRNNGKDAVAVLTNGKEVPVSRLYKHTFRERCLVPPPREKVNFLYEISLF